MVTNNATDTSSPLTVAQGGSGLASTTAYAVVCGGTTTTAPLQSVSGVGTSGQVLTSNGAAALPTFQTVPGGKQVLITTQTVSGVADVEFNSLISGAYKDYFMTFSNVSTSVDADSLLVQVSDDGGSTWKATGYDSTNFRFYPGGATTASSTTGIFLSAPAGEWSTLSTGAGDFTLFYTSSASKALIQGKSCFPSTNFTGGNIGTSFGGQCPASLTINSIRFVMSSGNISGNFSLYGIVE